MAKKKKLNTVDLNRFSAKSVSKESKLIRVKVLIVCEGEKTEPNYFRSFSQIANGSGYVYDVTTEGGGINTLWVVDKAAELKKKAESIGQPYDTVWAVFDKDSFLDQNFDNAVVKARKLGIGCAWSNEAFELWYVLHFDSRCTAMSRKDYQHIIEARVNGSGKYPEKRKYVYKKNDKAARTILTTCGDEMLAVRYAERLHKQFEGTAPHSANPCTTVYELVRLLLGQDKNFNDAIKHSVDK